MSESFTPLTISGQIHNPTSKSLDLFSMKVPTGDRRISISYINQIYPAIDHTDTSRWYMNVRSNKSKQTQTFTFTLCTAFIRSPISFAISSIKLTIAPGIKTTISFIQKRNGEVMSPSIRRLTIPSSEFFSTTASLWTSWIVSKIDTLTTKNVTGTPLKTTF